MASWLDASTKAFFPELHDLNCLVTSQRTKRYNCIAWAAGIDNRRWDLHPSYYWPPHAKRDRSQDALIEAYEQCGFAKCSTGVFEEGYLKIALYAKDGLWTHAARQLDDGNWTSKLGDLEDFTHYSVGAIEGPGYGKVYCYMKRAA